MTTQTESTTIRPLTAAELALVGGGLLLPAVQSAREAARVGGDTPIPVKIKHNV
jgi:hypothetical protein